MRKFLLITILFQFSALIAQPRLPAALYPDIFRSYTLQSEAFYGVFDSTDSYFVVHFDSIVQSNFDSTAILGGGKIWHREQTTSFKAYISLDSIKPMINEGFVTLENDPSDTIFRPHWAFDTEAMKIQGTSLWHCSGELTMVEDTSSEFAGAFNGMFDIYFYYRPQTGFIKPLPAEDGYGLEPGLGIIGFWNGFFHPEFGTIPFSLANTPLKLEGEKSFLPDLRIQKDGSSSFSNIATYGKGCLKPPFQWYQ